MAEGLIGRSIDDILHVDPNGNYNFHQEDRPLSK